jgi:hypothetical protein
MPLGIRSTGTAVVLAAVALCAFGLGWWQSGDLPHPPTLAAGSEWNPPKPAALDLSAYANILSQRQPFGAAAAGANAAAAGATGPNAAGPAKAAGVQWRVGGIVTAGTDRYLVVLIRKPGENATRTELRHPGEDLPDGSVVRTVEPTSVTIDRQGTIVSIKMFAQN